MRGKSEAERVGNGIRVGELGGERMEREQATIRLPAELKKKLQQETDKVIFL